MEGKVRGSVGKQWEREQETGEREGYWKTNSTEVTGPREGYQKERGKDQKREGN